MIVGGVNGFAKIFRGNDTQAIESDCWWVEPDLSEVKLVSEPKPKLGGSQYGLVDELTASASLYSSETAESSTVSVTFLFFMSLFIALACVIAVTRALRLSSSKHTSTTADRQYQIIHTDSSSSSQYQPLA